MAWAIGPPSLLRLSVPHSTSATVSGMGLPLATCGPEQQIGLARTVRHRKCRWNAERVEAVQIAARGQDGGRADQVAAGNRADEARHRAHGAIRRSRDPARGVPPSSPCRPRDWFPRRWPACLSRASAVIASPTTWSPCGMSVYSSSRMAVCSAWMLASASVHAGSAWRKSTAAACAWTSTAS